MRISAIVCTYRNPSMLRECLNSLIKQTYPLRDFEILVIDNNSQDETPVIVSEFLQSSVSVHYIFEPTQGLSYARNRGILESKGEIVAFTDDDAIVDERWIENIAKSYNQSNDIWAVGGKTLPLWQTTRPEWITDDMLVSLSIRDYGENPRLIKWPERMIGVNCSFRKTTFELTGYFDINLGRKGDILYDQEDITIQTKMHDLGMKIYYSPDILVWHIITGNRVTHEYFNRRSCGHSRTCCIIDYKEDRRKFIKMILHHLKESLVLSYRLRRDKSNLKINNEYAIHKAYIYQAFILLNPFKKK